MKRALVLIVTAVTASACRFERPADAQAVAPELRLEGVRFRIYRADALHAFGTADVASLRRDSTQLRAQTLDAVLPRDGNPVRITAPVGEGTLSARTFDASGGIVAERAGDTARTERAHYEPGGGKDGLVRGSDPVTVEGRGYRLDGHAFTLDPAAGRIAVGGGARLVTGLVPALPLPRGAGQGRGLVPALPLPRGAGQGRGLVPALPLPRGAGQGRGLPEAHR